MEEQDEAIRNWRFRQAARLNKETYYSSTPLRAEEDRMMEAVPMSGACLMAKPFRTAPVLPGPADVELHKLQGTRQLIKCIRKRRASEPLASRNTIHVCQCCRACTWRGLLQSKLAASYGRWPGETHLLRGGPQGTSGSACKYY